MSLDFLSALSSPGLDRETRCWVVFELGWPLSTRASRLACAALCACPCCRMRLRLCARSLAGGSAGGVGRDARAFAGAAQGGLLFGVMALSEDGVDRRTAAPALRHSSRAGLSPACFRLLDAQGLPHLWRVWNYIPDINGEQAGLERYRQFNLGRGDAFERCARSVTEQVPAACALGVAGGPLSIAFMAGATPVVPIENPRQVSAYRYPGYLWAAKPHLFTRCAGASAGRRSCSLSRARPASWAMRPCTWATWWRRRGNP